VTAYVDDMGRKLAVSNELYDLCYRHLAAAGIDLRPLGVTGPVRDAVDPRERLLRRIDLFAALEGDQLRRVAASLVREEFEVGQILMNEETVPEALSIVDSGVLSVTAKEPIGYVEVGRLGPGDSVGEAGLLAGLPARVKITALKKSVVYQLRKQDLTPILKDNPEVAKRMCQLLSTRQEMLGKLSTEAPQPVAAEQSVFQWLLDKVRALHSLTL
jgi:CRP-like cAMP-binding protein